MGSSPHAGKASPEFLRAYRAQADASGAMTFERFMAIALYDSNVGYYRQQRPRVGYGPGTDFFTATSSGPIFGELVAAACATLLQNAGRNPNEYTFVEIGSENAQGILGNLTHPFAGTRTLRIGEPPELSGKCVLFSNELFDAQPCMRTVRRGKIWREIGVRLDGDGLVETEIDTSLDWPDCPDGYRFDRPLAAVKLAEALAAPTWTGLFVAFDYGKTLRDLTETPGGTVRAYHDHIQSNDVLAHPGEQDLTCHVCWDWIANALRRNGFAEPSLEFQEAFFIHHAADFIAMTSAAEAARFSQRKLALLQLLHPAQMGQKFQVLHALR